MVLKPEEWHLLNSGGQRVKTLVNGIMDRGRYAIEWNGIDVHERYVGSGIYFYRLQAGEYVSIKRMVLLK